MVCSLFVLYFLCNKHFLKNNCPKFVGQRYKIKSMSLTSPLRVRTIKIGKKQKRKVRISVKFLAIALLIMSAVPVVNVFAATPVSAASIVQTVTGTQYPYANSPWPNNQVDPWGMYKRQCVSYAAWAVSASGRHMPNWAGKGTANQWDDNARTAGIPVDSSPRVGDVAVRNSGTYGHVMYVDNVNSNGTINVSQYNANYNGTYSTATISTSGLVFIHFP
jgi:surface antigen